MARKFGEHEMAPRTAAYFETLARGKFDLDWFENTKTEWGVRVEPGKRGILLNDINVGSYGEVPEHSLPGTGMAPRGAELDVDLPSLGYRLNSKYEVWSVNAASLYEEAKTRQWNATTDIPWHELKRLPEDLERAMCQVCTLLTEVEFIAADLPAKWMHQIHQNYHEVKCFLASQVIDEARHLEVFRKRALANGGGLMRATKEAEDALQAIIEAPTYSMASSFMHVLGEGMVLSLFRAGELIGKTDVDKRIFRMCMQDEARHVSYGTMHLKYYLENHPNPRAARDEINHILSKGEGMMLAMFGVPEFLEPLMILAGGGIEGMKDAKPAVGGIWQKMVHEYFGRCDRAGVSERREQCRLPSALPM